MSRAKAVEQSSGFRFLDLFRGQEKPSLILCLITLSLAYAASCYQRHGQWEKWQENPARYIINDQPQITTLDAPFYFLGARHLEQSPDEIWGRDFSYPDNTAELRERYQLSKYEGYPVPLLSYLLKWFAPKYGNHARAGVVLMIFLPGLFIFPLGLFFYRLGLPTLGILGGVVGTFAFAYYGRSSVGRVDTDSLNLFFPALIALLTLLAGQAKGAKSRLVWSALAGAGVSLFLWWYYKPGFALAFAGTHFLVLLVRRIPHKQLALCMAVFVLLGNPAALWQSTSSVRGFLRSYVTAAKGTPHKTGADKPASLAWGKGTVTESRRAPLDKVLGSILKPTDLTFAGLVGFALLAVFSWKGALALLPFLGLAGVSFFSGIRFAMYLGPFVGVGLAYLVLVASRALWMGVPWLVETLFPDKTQPAAPAPGSGKKKRGKKKRKRKAEPEPAPQLAPETPPEPVKGPFRMPKWWSHRRVGEVLAYAVTLYAAVAVAEKTKYEYVPGTSLHPTLVKSFYDIGKKIDDGIVVTWWNTGYAIEYMSDLKVVNDGGYKGPKLFLVGRALATPDPKELHAISRFLAAEGNFGIQHYNKSRKELSEAVMNPPNEPKLPTYVLYTGDLQRKYGTITGKASCDLATGNNCWKGQIQPLNGCRIRSGVMTCQKGYKFEMKDAKLTRNGKKIRLYRRVMHINDKIDETIIDKSGGYTIQVHRKGNRLTGVYLLNDNAYKSTFNQMFLLGRYDETLFDEVHHVPHQARMFRVIPPKPSEPSEAAPADTPAPAAPAAP